MPNDREIEAPISLMGMWPDSDDEAAENTNAFTNESSEQTITVAGLPLRVRQFCFHTHNANRVWPGTFNLAEYYINEGESGDLDSLKDKRMLELGSATGLLSIRFVIAGITNIVTSDVDDRGAATDDNNDDDNDGKSKETEDDTVETNIKHNFYLNNVAPVKHIRHTWGTGWNESEVFDIIIASDILLYVAAYPALVKTLEELIGRGLGRKFIMSWNRRMDESKQFFEMMHEKGFECLREPKCVFIFTR